MIKGEWEMDVRVLRYFLTVVREGCAHWWRGDYINIPMMFLTPLLKGPYSFLE